MSKTNILNEKLIELIKHNGNLSNYSNGGITTKSIFKNINENAPTFSESIENFFVKSRTDRINI